MNDLAVLSSAGVTLTSHPGQNPFHVVFQPAKPTLDAVLQLQPALKWLERHRPGRAIDPEFLKLIPEEQDLLQWKTLFRQAEHEPAPEGWTGVALSCWRTRRPCSTASVMRGSAESSTGPITTLRSGKGICRASHTA